MNPLADQIINHQPWQPDALGGISATGAELNELRDELLELRQLRAAAETRERYEVGAYGAHGYDACLSLSCPPCEWESDGEWGQALTLAELNRRAAEHGEECR